jgi:hypothetical protein
MPNPTALVYCRTCGPTALRAKYFKYELAIKVFGAMCITAGAFALAAAVYAGIMLSNINTHSQIQSRIRSMGTMNVLGGMLSILAFGCYFVAVGWCLRRLALWARQAALVPAFVALFRIPVGTLLGIAVYVLLLNRASVYVCSPEYGTIVEATQRRRGWDLMSALAGVVIVIASYVAWGLSYLWQR